MQGGKRLSVTVEDSICVFLQLETLISQKKFYIFMVRRIYHGMNRWVKQTKTYCIMFVSILEWILKLSLLSINFYVFIYLFKNIFVTQYSWDINLAYDSMFVISWDVFMSLKVFFIIIRKQRKKCTIQKKDKENLVQKPVMSFVIFGVTLAKYMSPGCVWKLMKIVEVNWLVGVLYLQT